MIGTGARFVLWTVAAWCFLAAGMAFAQSPEEFYRGKQLRIVVGSAPGGGYDAYARTIAAHMGKHISGDPSLIVQNIAGVGSLIALNHVVNVAPKDGTVIAAIHPDAVIAPLFHPDQAKFDPRRLVWLGSPVTITYVVTVWHTAPVRTFDDLFTKELIVAGREGTPRCCRSLPTACSARNSRSSRAIRARAPECLRSSAGRRKATAATR